MLHQSSRDRIPVHVFQFLKHLLLAPHIEIVDRSAVTHDIDPSLPETGKFRTSFPESKLHLCRHLPSVFGTQFSRHPQFQNVHNRRRRSALRFSHQEMHVLRHNHISHDQKPIFRPNLIQDPQENIPRAGRTEQRKPSVTAEGKEVKIFPSIIAFQILWHERKKRPHLSLRERWGTLVPAFPGDV